MKLDILTIFPAYFAPLDISLLGKARRTGLLDIRVHDLRDWTHDRHRTVDDTPYGGGPGMVMKPEPWGEALDTLLSGTPPPGTTTPDDPAPTTPDAEIPTPPPEAGTTAPKPPASTPDGAAAAGTGAVRAASEDSTVAAGEAGPGSAEGAVGALGAESDGNGPLLIIPTPSGRPFTQVDAERYAAEPWLVFACGRYEGIDSRVVEDARTRMRVEEVSLGDFVLAGGEVAALVMIEAIGRLVPGVLGNADSIGDDSFAPGAMESLVEGPVYTKPPVWRERPVPDVLLSGNHGAIARWRRDEALRRTAGRRPELLSRLDPAALDERDRQVLRAAGFPVDAEGVAD